MTATHDLTNKIPELASALGVPMESVAIYCEVSATQLRRWLAGGKGATQNLKNIYVDLKQLESFRDRCPLPCDFKKVANWKELRHRIKSGETAELVREFRTALREFSESEPELTQEEKDTIAAAVYPFPVLLDSPQLIRRLLADLQSGNLLCGISNFGNLKISGHSNYAFGAW
jgi:hypothetical protein